MDEQAVTAAAPPEKKPKRVWPKRSLDGRKRSDCAEREYGIPAQRCVATSRMTGEQCKRYALAGHHLCISHCGNVKNARERAAKVLQRAALPAAEKLYDLMDNSKDESIQYKAAAKILEYTVEKATHHIEVVGKIDHSVSTESLMAELANLTKQVFGTDAARIDKAKSLMLPAGEVIPAEFEEIKEPVPVPIAGDGDEDWVIPAQPNA